MHIAMLSLCAVLLSLGGAHAQEAARPRAAERAVIAKDQVEGDRGLETIAGESAEVEADDEAGLVTQDDGPSGGMSTVEDEMVDAENTDGCTGAMGAGCAGGDN